MLVLKSGDRISGDVKRIWDAELTIEPEYSDEFQVDLDAIFHIESTRDFEIVGASDIAPFVLKNTRFVVSKRTFATACGLIPGHYDVVVFLIRGFT